MQFQPAVLTIKKGDTVTWINKDFVDHDVTEEKIESMEIANHKSRQKVQQGYYCQYRIFLFDTCGDERKIESKLV